MKFGRVILLFAISMMGIVGPVSAQEQGPTTTVQCGDIIESEFTQDNQPQRYIVTMAPGDVINVSAAPLGDTLQLVLIVTAPNGDVVGLGGSDVNNDKELAYVGTSPTTQTGVLSARGEYTITAYNARYYGGFDNDYHGGIGVYTLYLGCTLRDGAIIEPGDTASSPENEGDTVSAPFTGIGFPGLASKDFNDGITIPFMIDSPNAGAINPGFESVFGFTLDASAGDKLNLTFMRTSGNLNLSMAVLSPDNQIIYQASLVSTEQLSALFSFPVSGQYTIGVWKIDLAPPATPENTAFQLIGTLNP